VIEKMIICKSTKCYGILYITHATTEYVLSFMIKDFIKEFCSRLLYIIKLYIKTALRKQQKC